MTVWIGLVSVNVSVNQNLYSINSCRSNLKCWCMSDYSVSKKNPDAVF